MHTGNLVLQDAPDQSVAEAVFAAIAELFDRDALLFQVDANERAITHHLTAYLAPRFSGWHVDCEYNRDGFDPKMVDLSGGTTIRTRRMVVASTRTSSSTAEANRRTFS